MQKEPKTGVSMIMCCYNSEKIIQKSLEAMLEQQTNIPCEIIIVDNNCTDNTVSLVKKIYKESSSGIHLTIINEPNSGISNARKKGFLEAKYPYISFIDDDNVVQNDWVGTVHDLFQKNPEIGILGSSNEALFLNGKEPEWFDRVKGSYACNTQGGDLEELTITRRYVYGAGMCIRKEILAEVYDIALPMYLSGRRGGRLLSGDDSELGMRAILLGYRMYCSDQLKLKHMMTDERLTWNYFRKMSEGHKQSSIILQVYSSLIQCKIPPRRREIIKKLMEGWKKYIKKYKFRHLDQPNHISSLTYIYLKGRTVGMLSYFNDYDNIVQDIVNVLGSRSKSS